MLNKPDLFQFCSQSGPTLFVEKNYKTEQNKSSNKKVHNLANKNVPA